ncbi:hypothetical protein SCORR_v1c09740 [Spiroplasma corruscae]|uniref:DUF4064 domain-containing protein n=1 Tax=Spiroplasma corruscae TaxID=216934 RepID=A0A222EQQ2_9MOLU|nr:hypothetical protein [Spiroplasma corruscae]ASP28746.1 hypothetical protein SCORR_v1c09740 [Spiroplasma corruscae]
MNGLAKGGIITSFIGAGFSCIFGLLFILAGTISFGFSSIGGLSSGIFIIIGVLSLILPIVIIVTGAMALSKGSNQARIACGIIALVSILFSWAAYFIPFLLFLIGGILTLCGKKN